MKIENRIYKTELVEWQKVNDLQPENLKLPYNYEHIKNTILKYGVSKAYDVCEIDRELYWIDGHTRTQILFELLNDGIKIPEKLTANFCKVKDRKEAIEILLEVHNQRQNPIAGEVLTDWIEVEQLEVNVDTLNVIIDEDTEDEINNESKNIILDFIGISLNEDEASQWNEVKRKLNKKDDKKTFFHILNKFSNEN